LFDYEVPPSPDEIVYVDRPVLTFDDPEFAFPAATTDLPSTAAAGGFHSSSATFAAGRFPRIADSRLCAGSDLVPATRLRGSAAQQHDLCQHPQQGRGQRHHEHCQDYGSGGSDNDLAGAGLTRNGRTTRPLP
jgi:hypothetical protein